MKLVCISNVELGRDSRGRPRHNIIPLTIGQTYECETTYTSSNPVKNYLNWFLYYLIITVIAECII
jgi:hypothetical protein